MSSWLAPAPPPIAILVLSCVTSRVSRLLSVCSLSIASTALILRARQARRRSCPQARTQLLRALDGASARSALRCGGRRPRRRSPQAITKKPMSPVALTCVPPHSSMLNPGIADDADLVAVFLAEQRHRAGGDRLLGRANLGRHRRVAMICSLTIRFDPLAVSSRVTG